MNQQIKAKSCESCDQEERESERVQWMEKEGRKEVGHYCPYCKHTYILFLKRIKKFIFCGLQGPKKIS